MSSGPATLGDLRSMVMAAVRRIGRGFERPDDDWLMVAFLHSPTGLEIVGLANDLFANGMSKSALGGFLRDRVASQGVYRYALLLNVHGFMYEQDDEEGRAQMERVQREELRVEQIEGAQEYLWLLVGDAETEEVWYAPIERTPRYLRTPGRWKRIDDQADATLRGRFVGLNEYMREPRR